MSIKRPRFDDEESAQTINISPLIDVIFILLIFFIVTMVFADSGAFLVDSPQAGNVEKLTNRPLTISIDKSSKIYIDSNEYSVSELKSQLALRIKNGSDSVLLNSDENAPVSVLVMVMDIAKECGANEIFVAARKPE